MYSSRVGFPLLIVLNALLTLGASIAFAAADSKSHFDLPAEPLDKALQDFAIQVHYQISYEPSLVAGIRAPALKGEFTPSDALSMLLKGTKLRAVYVGKDVIRVLEKGASASQNTTSETPSSNTSGGALVRSVDDDGSNRLPGPDVAPGSDRTASGTGDNKPRDNKDLEEIIVTGTHIRGVSMASPTIEIGREEIDRSGYTSIADLMLSLPQNFGGGYNAATAVNNSVVNSAYSDNPTGASVPNLRGLGPGSTLTLVDGHRMAAGLTGGGADIASIPIDAIDRIEVLTDSASAIYGSDAVAGVVNVILKRNYDGAETSLSYGLATNGGGTEKRASQLFGTHWNGGDVLIAYEHSRQDAVDARDREFTSSALGPTSLLPQVKSDSVTLSATQDLSTTTAVFVDALYVARDADRFMNFSFFPAPAESSATLRKYAAAVGLNFNLTGDWKAALVADAAEDDTKSSTTFLTRPSTTLAYTEHLLGTMRSAEANANGGIATLPSGIVRLAVGVGYRKEGFSDAIGAGSAGPAFTSAEGDRNIRYAFGELAIPLVPHSQRSGCNSLDLIVSGRNERYSDFGQKTVPKVGLVYVPTNSIKLRATWGKAFRAPNLNDKYGLQQLVLLGLPNPASSTGSSPALVLSGGNPSLQPETANAWTIGTDYFSPELGGLQVSTTIFDIKYTNRILSLVNPYTALTDPLNAFFVTPSPSASLAQSVYDSYPSSEVFNETGAPFDPSKIGAIVDNRLVNVASQTARGADLNIGYKIGAGSNYGRLFLNATYLDLTQRNSPQAPQQTLSGLAFYPAKFRARGGATWKLNAWALTGTVNYLPRETNSQVTPFQAVGSWTTADASLRFAPVLPGVLSGIHISLAVLNVFDKNPPALLTTTQGLNYDSANTSPMGRFLTLQISKEW
jgi:outer membrane receptor protein involved in Fe transport